MSSCLMAYPYQDKHVPSRKVVELRLKNRMPDGLQRQGSKRPFSTAAEANMNIWDAAEAT